MRVGWQDFDNDGGKICSSLIVAQGHVLDDNVERIDLSLQLAEHFEPATGAEPTGIATFVPLVASDRSVVYEILTASLRFYHSGNRIFRSRVLAHLFSRGFAAPSR